MSLSTPETTVGDPVRSQLPAAIPPRRRWKRKIVIAMVCFATLYFVSTNPIILGKIVLWQLGRLAGGKVTADRARVSPSGRVVLENFSLRSAAVAGPAGYILSSDRIEARVEFTSLLFGGRLVDSIEIVHPVIRLSQGVESGELNIATLKARGGSSSGTPTSGVRASDVIPRIRITDGVIEVGEHSTDPGKEAFTVLKRIDFEGDVETIASGGMSNLISFKQLTPLGQPPPAEGFDVQGSISETEISLTIPKVRLADFPPETVPTPIREAYRRLNLSGDISYTKISYRLDGPGLEVNIGLLDVSLQLPLSPRAGVDKDDRVIPVPAELEGRRLQMKQVRGDLKLSTRGMSGTLDGLLEELPYTIRFNIDGLDESAAFTARLQSEGFELTQSPGLALFAPGIVRRRLEQFSNPTGTLDADITIARAAPINGVAPPVSVNGTLTLTNGSAAFERFPYRFYNMTMNAVFSDQRLVLSNIRGSTPDGSSVVGTANISPLTDDAGVVVDVMVTGLPVNSTLAAAMKQRGAIIDTLFNDRHYQTLLARGLVAKPAAATPQTTSPSDVSRPSAPEFVPGGAASVHVLVTRKEGSESIWNDTVDIHFDTVSVLPEAFPYPMIGTDVTIRKVDYDIRVHGGSFRGLRGGTASLTAVCDLQQLDMPGAPFVPLIDVVASGVPADDLLRYALPEAASLSPDGRALRDLIQDLHLDGTGDATIKIWQLYGDDAAKYGVTGYDIGVTIASMSASPARASEQTDAQLHLSAVAGTLAIRHTDLDILLRGQLTSSGSSNQPPAAATIATTPGTLPAFAQSPSTPSVAHRLSPFEVRARLMYAPRYSSARGGVAINVAVADVDITTPAERLLSLFAPEVAGEYVALRAQLNPQGRLDVASTLAREGSFPEIGDAAPAPPPAAMIATTTLSRPKTVSLTLLGTRMTFAVTNPTDPASLIIHHRGIDAGASEPASVPASPQLEFKDAAFTVSGNDGPAGVFVVSGLLPLSLTPHPTRTLTLLGTDVHPQSSVVRAFLKEATSKGISSYIEEVRLSGLLDLNITAGSPAGPAALGDSKRDAQQAHAQAASAVNPAKTVAAASPDAWAISGRLQPRSLAAVMGGQPVSFPTISGDVTFSAQGGRLEGIVVAAQAWEGRIQGGWSRSPDGVLSTSHTFSVQASSLTPDLIAVLPEDVRVLIADLAVTAAAPVTVPRAALSLTYDAAGALESFTSSGQVLATDLSLDAGLKITNAITTLDFEASRSGLGQPVSFQAWAWCDQLRAADIHITNAKLRIESGTGADQGAALIPHFSAECHGGRLFGDAVTRPSLSSGKRSFEARVQGSNIRFASILQDLRTAKNLTFDHPIEPDITPDGSRGLLDFGVTLSGLVSDAASRRGRGTASISGGRVMSLPLVVPLIRMTNLQLPIAEKLSYAQADFFIQGNSLQFEQAWIASPGVDLVGYGTVDWPTLTVDARVRGKSRLRIPVVSKVLESIRDELFTARITGPASNLTFGFESFSGTSRLIQRIIGATPSEADEKLRFIEKNADLSPKRSHELNVEPAVAEVSPP